jgi:hypothetical protein
MADQQETLRIKVDLDTGQATRNLQAFQQAASQVGSTVQHARNQAKPAIEEWQKAVANLTKEALGVGRVFGELTKILNPWTLGIGLIGYELFRQLGIMKEWARNITEMGNSARMAGLRLGEFRSISDQLRQAGISAQASQSLIQNFSRAYAELMQPGSERRAQLFAMGGAQFAGGMQQALVRLSTLTTETQRLNYIRHLGLNVYANEFSRTHDKQLATYKEEIFLQLFGAQELINRQTDFRELTEEQLKRQDQMQADAAELNAALEKERQTREEIFNLTFGWATKFETKIVDIGKELEDQIVDQLKQIHEGTWTPWASPEHPAALAPGLQPGKTKEDWSKVLRPQQFAGDRADVFGLAPGSLGYGDISQGWRRSTNVEDDRTQEQVQAVDTNTKEFHDLNQRIERLIDTGVFGRPGAAGLPQMAEGGGTTGRTVVGEKGPEIVKSVQSGQSIIVASPTVVGAGQSVTPLGKGYAATPGDTSSLGRAMGAANLSQRIASGEFTSPNRQVETRFPKGPELLAGLTGKAKALRGMREGGIVTKPTHALIGEAGPEAVIPLKHGLVTGPATVGELPTKMAEGGANYLERTQLLSNPVTDIGSAVRRAWTGIGDYLNYRGAQTPTEALQHALPSLGFARAAGGLALSPVSGAVETTAGRAYAGLTGMPRESANTAVETALSAVRGVPAISDIAQLPAASRFTIQGLKQVGSLTPPQSGGQIEAFADQDAAPSQFHYGASRADVRAAERAARLSIDKDLGKLNGAVEGTVEITHQDQPASAKGGRTPLFRPVRINRQAQMQHASGGPATTFSQDEMAAG